MIGRRNSDGKTSRQKIEAPVMVGRVARSAEQGLLLSEAEVRGHKRPKLIVARSKRACMEGDCSSQ